MFCSLKGYLPDGEQLFPHSIGGLPVDVREGYVVDCVNRGCNDFNDPLGLGCRISIRGENKSGAIGLFTESQSRIGCTTCAHVVFSPQQLKSYFSSGNVIHGSFGDVFSPGYDPNVPLLNENEVIGKVTGAYVGPIHATDPISKDEVEVDVDLATIELGKRTPGNFLKGPDTDRSQSRKFIQWNNIIASLIHM